MKRLILSMITIATVGLHAQTLNLSLQECRQLALEHNESLKAAENAVNKAKLDRQIAFAQYLPKVDGSITALQMKDQDIIGMSLQTRGTYLAGINITLPLYVGGQLTAANRLAKIGQTVSEEQQRKARMQVIADVDNAYYTLISVQSKIKMLEAYARQMQGLYDQVELSVRVEMATENDLLRIATKQNEINYQLQKANNGEQLCQLALANVIGTDFDVMVIPTDTLLEASLTDELSEDFSTRPDLILLQQQVKANELQVKRARSNYLPTVALVGSYSHYDNLKLKGSFNNLSGMPLTVSHTFSGGNPYALLSVQVPIFHWGAELKKVKKAKLDLNDSQLQLEQNERGMRIQVRQAVQNITDGQRMVETATIGQKQADENLRVMRQKFDNQLCSMTDLLDAQSQWQQARSNLIEAQTQLKIYETEYLRVTGHLE
ncbi:MAG: TolC family protein [Bacteroidaceae bacterium]|nr:TolC family protein [Bacteroidaceae bacterium]